jgi:hypothetical protein
MGIWKDAFYDPVVFAREFLEIDPHPGQAEWLRKTADIRNSIPFCRWRVDVGAD